MPGQLFLSSFPNKIWEREDCIITFRGNYAKKITPARVRAGVIFIQGKEATNKKGEKHLVNYFTRF
jgi:hypothetical protein